MSIYVYELLRSFSRDRSKQLCLSTWTKDQSIFNKPVVSSYIPSSSLTHFNRVFFSFLMKEIFPLFA